MQTRRSKDSSSNSADECVCRKCLRARDAQIQVLGSIAIPVEMTMMIFCPACGNKRCPHATDHDLACTGSNEPGQKGSVYE